MKKGFTILMSVALLCTFLMTGCSKEAEVGYGGEVKTAPGGKAPEAGKGAGGPMKEIG